MPAGVQVFSCPRCKRGEFRSLPMADGRAYCPWCGDAVSAEAPSPAAEAGPAPIGLAEIAERIAGTVRDPAPAPAAPDPALRARLAEVEAQRNQLEAELRKEQDKRQEIKQAVLMEMARLEAQLAEARERARRKDEEHAASLEVIAKLKENKEGEWSTERQGLLDLLADKEHARKGLEAKLEEQQKALEPKIQEARKDLEAKLAEQKKSASDLESALSAARAETAKLRKDLEAAGAERADLRKKLAAADSRLKAMKEAAAPVEALKQQLQDATTKATSLQTELGKRDQRIKELQLLIKTLGERLNDLADRPRRAPTSPSA